MQVNLNDEREAIVAWLRLQSDQGANRGNECAKGTTKRAAFGGGSLALSRAADAIEAGEHMTNDNTTKADRLPCRELCAWCRANNIPCDWARQDALRTKEPSRG